MSDVSKNWVILLGLGCLFVIAGVLALLNPFGASLTVEFIAGWSFVVLGVIQFVNALREKDWGGRLWTLLMGVVAFLVGVSLVANPLQGLVALTVLLGVAFVVSGAFKVIVGWRVHDNMLKWIVMISGAASLVLGLMILTNIPGSAAIALGIMLAIELLSNGAATIALALSRKSGGVAHA